MLSLPWKHLQTILPMASMSQCSHRMEQLFVSLAFTHSMYDNCKAVCAYTAMLSFPILAQTTSCTQPTKVTLTTLVKVSQ